MPRTITPLTTAAEIKAARQAFETEVTKAVYDRDFSAIGQAFNPMSMIGKAEYVYVKCEDDGHVVGLAYGFGVPDKQGSTFYIQDIVSKSGSHSGSAMVDWFAVTGNVGMPALAKLQLAAATAELQTTYAKPHYGFTLDHPGARSMSRPAPR